MLDAKFAHVDLKTLLALVLVLIGWASSSHALTLQGPADAPALTLPEGNVACAPPDGGWILRPDGKAVVPPAGAEPGREGHLQMAESATGCEKNSEVVQLLVTGPVPNLEAASTTLSLATGQLDLAGTRLRGLRLRWKADKRSKTDACNEPVTTGARETCAVAVGRELEVDPAKLRFVWVPEGGRFGADVLTFDHQGRVIPPSERELVPQHIVLGRVFSLARSVDVSTGVGEIEVLHPGAVASVECDGAQCELAGNVVVVRSVPPSAPKVTVRARLLPRVFVSKAGKLDDRVTREFEVARCEMDIVSGQPLRDVNETKILVRLPEHCVGDAEQHNWSINREVAPVERVETISGYVYVLLRVGRLSDNEVTVVASRPQDKSALAVANTKTEELPAVHTTLVLPGFGEVDFIPKNQEVFVAASAVAGGRLVPLAVPGAYSVTDGQNGATIRGVYLSSGFTALRLGYRVEGLPPPFTHTNFAVLTDPIQRPIREANLPISLGASAMSSHPVFELRCRVEPKIVARILPGTVQHVPFSERDSCRLLIHKARIPADSGEQLVEIDVSVTTAGEVERGEARLSEKLLLRHAKETDVIWIRGALQQFDRIRIRVTHVVDEARYLLGHGRPYRLPSAQWTIVTEDAWLKFYATATIPSGLFRFSDDPQDLGTGAMALNFGVLSRLTMLSDEGKESLVGLEGGVMSMGLATEKDRQLAIVAGLGIGVPLGNVNQPTQASLNIHAWIAYSLGKRTGRLSNEDGSPGEEVRLNPWAFIFGPSITIGSLAAFL